MTQDHHIILPFESTFHKYDDSISFPSKNKQAKILDNTSFQESLRSQLLIFTNQLLMHSTWTFCLVSQPYTLVVSYPNENLAHILVAMVQIDELLETEVVVHLLV
jgi:hypothetical protein